MNDNNIISSLAKNINEINTINFNDIPNINLYADQVTSFTEDSLYYLKREEKDKLLTKSMINNYTKHKVVPPPINKKYNKEQVALLMLITILKPILSLNDISSIFNAEINNTNFETIYKTTIGFINIEQENLLKNLETNFLALKEKNEGKNTEMGDGLLFAISLAAEASVKKYYSERLLDEILKQYAED